MCCFDLSKTAVVVIFFTVLPLTGCASKGTIAPSALEPPAPRYMRPLRALVPVPKNAAANQTMINHAAALRRQCVVRGQIVRGLQSYAKNVAKKRGK